MSCHDRHPRPHGRGLGGQPGAGPRSLGTRHVWWAAHAPRTGRAPRLPAHGRPRRACGGERASRQGGPRRARQGLPPDGRAPPIARTWGVARPHRARRSTGRAAWGRTTNSQQKATTPLTAVPAEASGTFNPLRGVLCILRSLYLCAIGPRSVCFLAVDTHRAFKLQSQATLLLDANGRTTAGHRGTRPRSAGR